MARLFSHDDLEYFKALLSYNPDNGLFRWRRKRNGYQGGVNPGDVAGTGKDGYVAINIEGTQYRAHILAWWFMMGEAVPKGFELDHINRKRNDNRWENLRLIKRSRNNHNANPTAANKSGVRGVSWFRRDNKWDARITIDKKVHVLGRFELFEDAVKARRDAELRFLGEYSMRAKPPSEPAIQPDITVHAPPSEETIAASRKKKSMMKRSTNTSGYPGVGLHKSSGKWHARIVVKYQTKSLGYHSTFEDAVAARKVAEALYFKE